MILRAACFCSLLALLPPAAPRQRAGSQTVAEVLQTLGCDATGLSPAALTRRVTGHGLLAGDSECGLAYYEATGGDQLRPPLYVILRERSGAWREAAIRRPSDPNDTFGSAQAMRLIADLVLIDTHHSPSAGELLVLRRRDLSLRAVLYGSFQTAVVPGMLIFAQGMMHFAPAHPQELHVFDLQSGRQSRLYSTDYHSAIRREFVERLRPHYVEAAKRQSSVYGWDPEWYNVSVDRHTFAYESKTDSLAFRVTFSGDRHPADIAPPVIESLLVTCRPMTQTSRRCMESR